MKFVFTKKITCEDSIKCSEELKTKIENKYGKLKNKKELYGHVSIYHENNNHKVWLFLYDKDKTHESESHGKDIKQENELVRKFKGITPQLKDLEKL